MTEQYQYPIADIMPRTQKAGTTVTLDCHSMKS